MFNASFKDFCERNRITQGEWESSDLAWDTLVGIARDHDGHKRELLGAAEYFGRQIQQIDGVHSVRFRVKDTEHLLAKIIRKKLEGREAYDNIDASNYHQIITDLVGVRALHLFKDDCFLIDRGIKAGWHCEQPPVVYVRDGDPKGRLEEAGFEIKDHAAGYRSVHYVVSTQPGRRKIYSEIQVRTIFEEGWAEIDHTVKYPNYSDNEAIVEFLRIFNRLAGAADEMGSYVKGLAESVADMDRQIASIRAEKDDAIRNLESAIAEAQLDKEKNAKYSTALARADTELKKLKASGNKVAVVIPQGDSKSEIKPEDYLAFFSSLGKWIADANRNKVKSLTMGDNFQITAPLRHSTGDFLSFTILDGDAKIPARISGTAIALLDRDRATNDPMGVFEANKDRIRKAAFDMRRMNPTLGLIALGSNNFVSQAKA
ncbi:conserved hypothetical protein [Cupriavidus necator]|uniref:RelA/SpoT domain-containing protein n=1 Tax=Cupriavidus necator TaxID=106590 RepID=A0A1K0JK31_CUPNE|nr:conserved hypothetical protein [Cupriavidus necator]